ncbi:MAG: 2-hydroxyglutaryl-CoA dehydratase, partial [Anaerolineae bacterium]|nr:2-hydroxyglutaryl-CoA dehydratase [Anaerolineae bacterium]
MTLTAGIDVGSTYTKAVIVAEDNQIIGQSMASTGFKLAEIAERSYRQALAAAGASETEVGYIVATGFG